MPARARWLASLILTVGAVGAASAADLYPWRDHEAPFAFLFGNEIDTHQQTRQARDGSLFGFFYIRFTEVTTKDRYAVATHANCTMVRDCTVGWTLQGRPMSATFLYEPMHDHPVFLVARPQMPQPGAFAHFHWLGPVMPLPRQTVNGQLLQLVAVDRFCFIHHGAEGASAAATCTANGGVPVDPGIDIATHLNIVAAAPPGL